MEVHFDRTPISCLNPLLRQVQAGEETQELRLTEDMPDVGRVIAAWGQMILRGKEWRGNTISCSAGVMCRILYEPEDGSALRNMECWMPLQLRWNLDDGLREGNIRLECCLRGVDARSVSARKILVRCSYGVMAEVCREQTVSLPAPGDCPGDVQLLINRYPMRIPREAGEKNFRQEEELPLLSAEMASIVAYSMEPRVSDVKIYGDKLSFRGNGTLHLLYLTPEGKLISRDMEIPFSQFAGLDRNYGADAQADVKLAVTGLDVESDEQGKLLLKWSAVGQYLVDERQTLTIAEDAYSTSRELELDWETMDIPVILEQKQISVPVSQSLRADAKEMADVTYWADFPVVRRTEGIELELPGLFQAVWYDEKGKLQSVQARTEERWDAPCGENCNFEASVVSCAAPRGNVGNGLALNTEMTIQTQCGSTGGVRAVAGFTSGQPLSERGRASLVISRCKGKGLWELAKENLSTVDAIREANRLEENPKEGQMLLIPLRQGVPAET